MRPYNILIAFGDIPDEFRGWGSMTLAHNVTKIKSIRPFVHDIEPKMRVKLRVLVFTLFLVVASLMGPSVQKVNASGQNFPILIVFLNFLSYLML